MHKYLVELLARFPQLKICSKDIEKVYEILVASYMNCGKLLIAGNGGSAADAEHICGELMKGFLLKRHIGIKTKEELCSIDKELGADIAEKLQMPLPAIPLTGMDAFSTAYANDVDEKLTFAQKVFALGGKEDVLLAISTSGNSKNIIEAAIVAKSKHMKVVSLTGCKDSVLKKYSDATIQVPEEETYKIQELQLPIYHAVCMALEDLFFSE